MAKAGPSLSAKIGDTANVGFILLSIVYMALVYGHLMDLIDLSGIFGTNWSADGFCLSFKDTLAHSHLLCFYGDLILGALVYIAANQASKTHPELKHVGEQAPSIVMHGIAHLCLWLYNDAMEALPPNEPLASVLSPTVTIVYLVLSFAFWYSFLGVAFPQVTSTSTVTTQCVFHACMLICFLPKLALFGYTNAALYCNIGMINLYDGYLGEKDRFYALVSLASVPIMAATWAEPMLCDSFLIDWGGHILFDFSIPVSQLAFLFLATKMEPRNAVEKKTKAL